MRQSGILAAAGMYALKDNVARLQEDHDNAAWMAEQLREAGADVMRQDTNMLFVRVRKENAAALGEYMKARNVLINASPIVRLVTHLDVSREQLGGCRRPLARIPGALRSVPQRILISRCQWLHWSTSGAHTQPARASDSGGGASCRTGLQSCNW